MTEPVPLTLGTAGHIDHGKTALVRALTGIDTDRLPEERRRGISIALGYAPLTLPSGRRLSLVDVPGHERFVRAMVAGATGIDLYLMVVAADDGVMPQTREHAAVLAGLGIDTGRVAITKADATDPSRAEREARALLPRAVAYVACSALTGMGVDRVAQALDGLTAGIPDHGRASGEPVLHLDRAFTVAGIGTVVTGTLWAGTIQLGDQLALWPGARRVRVRGLQVHDVPHAQVSAGQRVAVNLVGVRPRDLARGDVLAGPGRVRESLVLDCSLALGEGAARGERIQPVHGERIQVHHGTRDVPGRLADLGDGLWQLRLEKPVLAADGDRVVVRRLSPPDTLGGGIILDADARRHGRRPEVLARLRARAAGEPDPDQPPAVPTVTATPNAIASPPPTSPRPADPAAVAALEARLRAADVGLLSEASLESDEVTALASLRRDGRAVRISGHLYAHRDVAELAVTRLTALLESTGSVSLAEARDLLGTGRRAAQGLLEHLDARRITRRGPDDRRVLRHRAPTGAESRRAS